jgi:hypothetical protein
MPLPFWVSKFPNMDWCVLHNILPLSSALCRSHLTTNQKLSLMHTKLENYIGKSVNRTRAPEVDRG